jgi:nitronate monooxygenase
VTSADLASRLRAQLALPVVVAPTFLCSGPALALEARWAGVMGTLTLNHCRDLEELVAQLDQVDRGLTERAEEDPVRVVGPFAVNTSLRLDSRELGALVAVCAERGASALITANGRPDEAVRIAHDHGLPVVHDVTSLTYAEKAVAAGVDGLVAIGAGGGGHSGTISPLTFVPILRRMFDGLIVLAGSITTGAMVRAAEVLGADLAYMGTRFIATQESMAPREYKELLVTQGAEDVVYTAAVNGVPASWMRGSLQRVGLDPETMQVPVARGTGHLPEGVRPWRDVWSAGQGVALVDDVPATAELVERLRREYAAACAIPSLPRARGAA